MDMEACCMGAITVQSYGSHARSYNQPIKQAVQLQYAPQRFFSTTWTALAKQTRPPPPCESQPPHQQHMAPTTQTAYVN